MNLDDFMKPDLDISPASFGDEAASFILIRRDDDKRHPIAIGRAVDVRDYVVPGASQDLMICFTIALIDSSPLDDITIGEIADLAEKELERRRMKYRS